MTNPLYGKAADNNLGGGSKKGALVPLVAERAVNCATAFFMPESRN